MGSELEQHEAKAIVSRSVHRGRPQWTLLDMQKFDSNSYENVFYHIYCLIKGKQTKQILATYEL